MIREYHRISLSDGEVHTIPEEFLFETEDSYRKKYMKPYRVDVPIKSIEKCHFNVGELVND